MKVSSSSGAARLWRLLILGSSVACSPPDGTLISAEAVSSGPDVVHTSIRYSSSGLTIEGRVLVPAGAGSYPLVVYNHPGFSGISEGDVEMLADQVRRRGFAIVASAYRGEGDSQGRVEFCGGEVDDVRALIRVAENWPGIDASRRVLVGFSHGGCIALRLGGDTEAGLLGVVALGAPTDLDRLIDWHGTEGTASLAESWSSYVGEGGRAASPLFQERHSVPVAVLHGLDDDVVPLEQSCLLRERLGEAHRVATFQYSRRGQPVASDASSCHAVPSPAWHSASPRRMDGAIFLTYASVGHRPSRLMWDHAWGLASEWLQ